MSLHKLSVRLPCILVEFTGPASSGTLSIPHIDLENDLKNMYMPTNMNHIGGDFIHMDQLQN